MIHIAERMSRLGTETAFEVLAKARALEAKAWGGAALIGLFLLLFVWQGGKFFRRNRPGDYRPDALPPDVSPHQ